MSYCPICNTQYEPDLDKECSFCGWALEKSPVVIGTIPEVFVQRQQTRMKWGHRLWSAYEEKKKAFDQLQTQLGQDVEEHKAVSIKLRKDLEEGLSKQERIKSELQKTKLEKIELRDELRTVKREVEQANSFPNEKTIQSLNDRLRKQKNDLELSEKILDRLLPDLISKISSEISLIQNNATARARALTLLRQLYTQYRTVADHKDRLDVIQAIEKKLGKENQISEKAIATCLGEIGFQDPIKKADALIFIQDELRSQQVIRKNVGGDSLS